MDTLLTIAIPTFNRSILLNKCLNALFSQLDDKNINLIEFIVFDNDSKDDTEVAVNNFINNGYKINYYKNAENIGADRNIAACFMKATGKYVWVLSDDDFVLPGYLPLIIDLLKNNEFGNVYLNSIWYSGEFTNSNEKPINIDYTTYNDPLLFVEKVNYWFTFISGNIINKSILKNTQHIEEFYGSNFVQLSWTLPVIFNGNNNVVINNQLLACLSDNTGGYKIVQAFSESLNNVIDRLVLKQLVDKRIKRIINNHLLSSFFPMFIFKVNSKFGKENQLKTMLPIYWTYKKFWSSIFPALFKHQYLK